MLRALVLALLLANAGYYVWSEGLLAAYGLAPARQAEPERLARQIRPEVMRLTAEVPVPPVPPVPPVLNPAPPAVPVPMPQPQLTTEAPQARCLRTGPFNEKQVAALERRLQTAALPSGGWLFESPPGAARWVIYLGRYVSQEALSRRRARLEQQGIAFEAPVSPLLRPGFVLATFGSKAEAENALAQMTEPGLRNAKVVAERPELASQWLKFPAADAQLQARLEGFKPALADGPLQPCE